MILYGKAMNQKIENLLNVSLSATRKELENSESLSTGFNWRDDTWEIIVKYSGTLENIRKKYNVYIRELLYNYAIIVTDKNTIELQISNRIKFLLPKTGGYGAMLFILCGMALATLGCLIFFLITLRKEVQYSRLKRQRRNAIGK